MGGDARGDFTEAGAVVLRQDPEGFDERPAHALVVTEAGPAGDMGDVGDGVGTGFQQPPGGCDNLGHSKTTGAAPTSMDALAGGLTEFVDALGLAQVDLLGWSLGGIVVQAATLHRPDLVRRLIVAGSSPGGGVPDMPAPDPRIWQVATKPVNDDDDFLYLFFPESDGAHRLGVESLRRLDARTLSADHIPVSLETMQAQLAVIASTGSSVWDHLAEIAIPVLVANGAHDRMIEAYASYAMSGRLPNAKVVLYSDAGHGFLFQHIDDFIREVLAFLA